MNRAARNNRPRRSFTHFEEMDFVPDENINIRRQAMPQSHFSICKVHVPEIPPEFFQKCESRPNNVLEVLHQRPSEKDISREKDSDHKTDEESSKAFVDDKENRNESTSGHAASCSSSTNDNTKPRRRRKRKVARLISETVKRKSLVLEKGNKVKIAKLQSGEERITLRSRPTSQIRRCPHFRRQRAASAEPESRQFPVKSRPRRAKSAEIKQAKEEEVKPKKIDSKPWRKNMKEKTSEEKQQPEGEENIGTEENKKIEEDEKPWRKNMKLFTPKKRASVTSGGDLPDETGKT